MANLLKRVHWWAVTVSGNLCRKDLFLSTSSRTEHSQNLKGSKICTIIHSSEKVSTPDANFAKIPRIFRLNMKTYNVLGSDQYKTTTILPYVKCQEATLDYDHRRNVHLFSS